MEVIRNKFSCWVEFYLLMNILYLTCDVTINYQFFQQLLDIWPRVIDASCFFWDLSLYNNEFVGLSKSNMNKHNISFIVQYDLMFYFYLNQKKLLKLIDFRIFTKLNRSYLSGKESMVLWNIKKISLWNNKNKHLMHKKHYSKSLFKSWNNKICVFSTS